VPGLARQLGHQVQVDQPDVGVRPDRLGSGWRYQPDVGLGLGQRGQDLQPRLRAFLVGEQRGGLWRGPEVAEDR
jgi:hypothetical protein